MNGDKEIFLSKPSAPPFDEFIAEIKPIWDNRMFTNTGEKHKLFERELMSYLGCDNITLTVNGHMALELMLSALDIKGEVITTPFTFASTVMAIVRMGLKPVFCDIDPETLLLDPDGIEDLITDKTSAVMPVHLFGHICDIAKISKIAEANGLKVLYDGAHSFGALYKGRSAACYGDACMFSFHATKVFHSIEGGAVAFRDAESKELADRIKNFGLQGDHITAVGFNAKMNEICAAMGLCNLRHFDEYQLQREKCAVRYNERLSTVSGIRIFPQREDEKTNYSYYPIVVEEQYGSSRDELEAVLVRNGIHPRKYYVDIATGWDVIRQCGWSRRCPAAEEIAEKILVLPLNQDMDVADIDRICGIIEENKK